MRKGRTTPAEGKAGKPGRVRTRRLPSACARLSTLPWREMPKRLRKSCLSASAMTSTSSSVRISYATYVACATTPGALPLAAASPATRTAAETSSREKRISTTGVMRRASEREQATVSKRQ